LPAAEAIITSVSRPDDLHADVVRQLMDGRDVQENFRQLFVRYRGPVHNFFARKGFSPEDCRDLCQEVFVAVHSGIESLRSEAAFLTWLFSISRYVMLRHLDRHKTHSYAAAARASGATNDEGASSIVDSIAEPGPDPLRRVLDRERVELMRQALEELPPRVQDCLRARLVDGLNYREIGERLGISESTVAVHMHRGLKNLRSRLKIFFGEAPFAGEL